MDIDTLNVLEEFLENFPGVLILVSHDRYLLDKMSDQLFIMEGNGEVNIYNGNYSEYRISLETPKEKAVSKESKPRASADMATPKKLTFNEQKELEDLENKISTTETEIDQLTNSLIDIDSADYQKIQAATKSIETLNKDLEKIMERWVELSEKVN